jgi:hypothetical protein
MTTLLEDLIIYQEQLVIADKIISNGRAKHEIAHEEYELGEIDMLEKIIDDLNEIIDKYQGTKQ